MIGAARPVSGALAFFEANAFGPVLQDVGGRGQRRRRHQRGVGKKLPVEMLVYDDQSNLDTCMRLLEKLMVEDKVDFIFAPNSTAFFFAAAGVANDHGYLLMSAEGGATSSEQEIDGSAPVLRVLNFSDHYEIPVLAEIFEEVGVEDRWRSLYLDDLHGIEYSDVA